MRMLRLLLICAFLLEGCSTTGQSSTQLASNFIQRQHVTTITKEKYPPKKPEHVALYINQDKPMMPYRVIGVATVARHNFMGLSREDSTIHDMMKNLAASVGGDGLININEVKDGIQATIIQYQKILI